MKDHAKEKNFIEKRRSPRGVCFTSMGYEVNGILGMEYVHDISAWGVFIRTEELIPVGEYITINVQKSDGKTSTQILGRVIRTDPGGIGVQFAMGISDDVLQELMD